MVQTLMERSFTSMWVSQSETWHGHNWPVVGCDLSLYLRPCCQLSDRVIWATCHSMVSWYNYHFMKKYLQCFLFSASYFDSSGMDCIFWYHWQHRIISVWNIFLQHRYFQIEFKQFMSILKHSYWLSFKCIPTLIHKTLFMKGSWELRDIFL